MLCPKCGTFVQQDDIICPSCGALVKKTEAQEEGVRGIRQGRRAREATAAPRRSGADRSGASRVYVDPSVHVRQDAPVNELEPHVLDDTGRELETGYQRPAGRGSYGETESNVVIGGSGLRKLQKGQHRVNRRMINWTHVAIAGVVLLIALAVGGYLYLQNTAAGQRILVRMGRESTSAALWQVGEEALDQGNIDEAIANFETARAQDGTENVNVDFLLLLGSAYEAAGRIEDAKTLYTELYTDITPTRAEPYRNMIRLLLAEGNGPEAAALMQTAYTMTALATFRQQRAELLPTPPSVDLTAAYYEEKKYITLTSAENYDIYYTFDDKAELPAGGVKYTEPIFLDEGIHSLRAVAVNGDLVSDMLTGTYKIIMPSPQTPRSSLAPNTYKQRQRVWLKPGLDNEKDTDITIYYTIDGSMPDADSPIYTGDPIYLPGGRVYLKAVAVNGYGKASNTLEVFYKIQAKPYPLDSYTVADVVNGLTLYTTTREDFLQAYGQGSSKEDISLTGFDTPCEKYTYDWGYAVMGKSKTAWVLTELYFTSTRFNAPRGTGIGDEESFVVGKFCDMGQLESPSGNRGLYSTTSGEGKIYKQEDGTKIIRYTTSTADSHTWQLDYILNKSGVVAAIDMVCIP